MSALEGDMEPPMPAWAGDLEQVDAPLPDGRGRVYYRWADPAEAADAHDRLGMEDGPEGRASRESTLWTPEAGPAESDV
jgi:hypothetical protein